MGEKGIRHETAKKLASEANRAVGKGAVGREKGGGALPTSTLSPPQTSARFALLAIFFFFFFLLFPLTLEPGPGLHLRQTLH